MAESLCAKQIDAKLSVADAASGLAPVAGLTVATRHRRDDSNMQPLIFRTAFACAGACLIVVGLSGCAAHTWAPGPGVSEVDFGPTKARCSIMARHGGNSVEASGSTKFVAAVLIGNAIGNAVRANADFNDCMQASGFVVVDGQATQSPASAPPALPLPAAPTDATMPRSPVPVPQNVAFIPRARAVPEAAGQRDCMQALRANSYYEPLLPHLPNAAGQYSVSQLADTKVPTPEELTIVASFHDMAKPCADGVIAQMQAQSTSAAGLVAEAQAERDNSLSAFVAGGESWGEFAKQDQQIRADLTARLRASAPM